MTSEDLCYLDIAQARAAFSEGRLTPSDLVEAMLARIAEIDPLTGAYLAIDEAGAREAARLAGTGAGHSPLAGIPFAVKDNCSTRGIPTTANARLLADNVTDFDSAVVERLKAAGGVLTGKLNTWEYGTGLGMQFHDAMSPHSRNPWAPDHFPGGSSTGSAAAVAAGLATYALGADTGGSIRVPAAACGIHGLKPTYGLVSRFGVLPNSWSLDVVGPMARSAHDCAVVLQALAGADPRDPATVPVAVPDYEASLAQGIDGLRIGVVRNFEGAAMAPAVASGLDELVAFLRDSGAIVTESELPEPPLRYRETTTLISGSERACVHEADFRKAPEQIGREVREALTMGMSIRAIDYISALRRRRELAAGISAMFEDLDALVLPTTLTTAPSYRDPSAIRTYMMTSTTSIFSLSGHPAHAMPTGFDDRGLPTSAQIVGPYFSEAVILRIAHAYDRAFPHASKRPVIRAGSDPATYPTAMVEPEAVSTEDAAMASGFAALHGLPVGFVDETAYAQGMQRNAAAGAKVPRPASRLDAPITTFRCE